MKRVWAYYRVSTKSQVLHHDITLQRKACLHHISNFENWILEREIEDLAVSGYNVKLEERNGINRILLGAKQREFEVLLVFMLDRLGRKKDEMKYFFDELTKNGIEIWSVTEGFVPSFSNREAEYFAQCSKEVEKTSQRVINRFFQLKEEGNFTGGSAPFGYQIVKLKGKSELAILPKESEVVKKIFDLAYNSQFGSSKISQELNSSGTSTRNGKQWIYTTITKILRNPVYIGYPAYNKCSNLLGKHKRSAWKLQPKKENLVLVDEDMFFRIQKLMDKRRPYQKHSGVTLKDDFLLNELTYCGYCGKKLKSEINKNRPKKGTGKSSESNIYRRYVCDHAKNNQKVHNQRDFGAEKHENLIISLLMDVIKENTLLINDKGLQQEKKSLLISMDLLKVKLAQLYFSYFQKKSEKQMFIFSKLENDILELNKELIKIETFFSALISKEGTIKLLKMELTDWIRNFNECSLIEKRHMLERIIEKIILKKGSVELITKEYISTRSIMNQKNTI